MASHQDKVVIDIYGEGKTDVGTEQTQLLPGVPDQGVIPILVHRLCGEPAAMRVRRFGRPFQMKKGGLQEKSRLARMQSRDRKADGLVLVVDADGGDVERAAKRDKLAAGGDQVPDGPPMAVGVAQPCIEAWLLAAVWSRSSDSCRVVPESSLTAALRQFPSPEDLPTDSQSDYHPKRCLAVSQKQAVQDLGVEKKWQIAREVNLEIIKRICPKSFGPFAAEVGEKIEPLF